MDGATTAVEALPQRAPRGRRQQDRSRNDGDAPAAADNGTLKRSRQEATDEATQRRRCDGDTSAAADGAVTVTWHSSSERPATAGEAVDDKNGGGHDGQHYECACLKAQCPSSRKCQPMCGLSHAACLSTFPLRLGPHGGHPAPLMCVCLVVCFSGVTCALTVSHPGLSPLCRGRYCGRGVRLVSAGDVQLHGASTHCSVDQLASTHTPLAMCCADAAGWVCGRRDDDNTHGRRVRYVHRPLHVTCGHSPSPVSCSIGHDLQSLLFAFLDELLFVFHTESMVVRQLRVGRLDRDNWTLTAVACVQASCGWSLPSHHLKHLRVSLLYHAHAQEWQSFRAGAA